jgi:hypothetical protein
MQKYGDWTVLGVAEPSATHRHKMLRCQCVCGVVRDIVATNARLGLSTGCGCRRRREKPPKAAKPKGRAPVHGHASGGKISPTYMTWQAMRGRCENPRNVKYLSYGARGIQVCARWADFTLFLADMGERPSGHTIDRVDNDGDYEPGNCRWATPKQQSANQRKRVHSASAAR